MLALRLAVLASALFALPSLSARASGDPEPLPPNVLLIVLDDVGFEKLSWWPHHPFVPGLSNPPPLPRTPRLDQLRTMGIAFTNYWTDPSCSPARTQILTGRNSHRTGVGAPIRPSMPTGSIQLDENEVLLPELLQWGNPAYRTGAFGKYHIVFQDDLCHATRHGFERFYGHMMNVEELGIALNGHHFHWDKVEADLGSPCPTAPMRVGSPDPPYVQADWSSSVTRSDALAWIESLDENEPFFAYVAFASPHEPLQVPPLDLLSGETQAEIAGLGLSPGQQAPAWPMPYSQAAHGDRIRYVHWMIESIDTEIGRILDRLGELGRLEHTVVIVVSDNGTAQPQVEAPPPPPPPATPPPGILNPRHAKLWPYQLGARTPLIVAGDPVVAEQHRGSMCNRLVSAVDLLRTIAEISGMDETEIASRYAVQPQPWTLDSKSFRYLIADPGAAPPAERREYAIVEHFEKFKPHWLEVPNTFRRAVIHESGYKFTHLVGPPSGNEPEDFLYLRTDPDELDNLARFFLFTNEPALCPPFPVCFHLPPCTPTTPCSITHCRTACDPGAEHCDLPVLLDLLRTEYASRYCATTTSN